MKSDFCNWLHCQIHIYWKWNDPYYFRKIYLNDQFPLNLYFKWFFKFKPNRTIWFWLVEFFYFFSQTKLTCSVHPQRSGWLLFSPSQDKLAWSCKVKTNRLCDWFAWQMITDWQSLIIHNFFCKKVGVLWNSEKGLVMALIIVYIISFLPLLSCYGELTYDAIFVCRCL